MSRANTVFGFHAVNARLKHAVASIQVLYVSEHRHDARMRDLVARAEGAGVKIMRADDRRLDALAGQNAHQGVVALCAESDQPVHLEDVLANVDATTLLLLLDGVTDPRNLGACIRTAAAAGASAVVVPRDRSASLTDVASKTAAGAAEMLPLIAVTNLARAMDQIKEAGVWIAGAAADADRTIFALDLRGPLAWVLGAEGGGMRRLTRERCDWLAHIPMHGGMENLNVSVATGICLFETVRQRGLVNASGSKE
ncbi:MAG TPA: 23S rRNA (guanosine(2251)-2'-O)-methyltransferase RlmB [Burkholderiaceae bacterium]|nr:23S rRNA (guanosine(2251)-2'-O)-methyltransferase RlmB [Burkholderiaceae bacterium]